MNDVKARKMVYRIAFRNGGSNADPLLNCAGGGRMMLNTATETMTIGSGTEKVRLGFHGGGIVPDVCPTCPIELGSGMFLFVLGKGYRPIIRGFLRNRPPWTSGQETLIICEGCRDLDTPRGNLVLPQSLVMVAAPHLQNKNRLSDRRLDFDRPEEDNTIY